MKKLLAIALLALSLGGCASLNTFKDKVETAWSVVTQASVSPQAVIIAANAFDGLEATATNYLTLTRCNGTKAICRDPGATKKLIPVIRSGRTARDKLIQFLDEHPGQLGDKGLYDALNAAIDGIKAVVVQYNIGATP